MRMSDDLVYMRNRFYSPSLGRFFSEDPIGLAGGDVSFYRYVLNDPVNRIDPSGLEVYMCSEKADVPGNRRIGLRHTWLKTDSKEAGLGPAGGGIPGDNGQVDSPYIADTKITDHTGRSEKEGVSCMPLPNLPEDCVNQKLQVGKEMGKFGMGNTCHALVEKIIEECTHRCLH